MSDNQYTVHICYLLHMSTFCHCLKLPWGSHEVTCFNFWRRFSCELWEIFDNTSCLWCQCHGLCGVQKHGWTNISPKMDAYSTWFHMISPTSWLGPKEAAPHRRFNSSTTSENSNIIEIQIPLDCYEGVGEKWNVIQVKRISMSGDWFRFQYRLLDAEFLPGCLKTSNLIVGWRRSFCCRSRRSGISNGSWPSNFGKFEQGDQWPVEYVCDE